MEWDDLKAFGCIGAIILGIFLVVSWTIISISYHVNNVPIKCWVDDKLIYDGRSACIDVQSGGRTTIVNIKGGWYCQFPKAHYVSDNVKLEGSK